MQIWPLPKRHDPPYLDSPPARAPASGDHPGQVHIISAMEACDAYKAWHDKQTHKTFIRPDSGKRMHYYFYVQDTALGLVYLRVPTLDALEQVSHDRRPVRGSGARVRPACRCCTRPPRTEHQSDARVLPSCAQPSA
jgi:hypothetical protein